MISVVSNIGQLVVVPSGPVIGPAMKSVEMVENAAEFAFNIIGVKEVTLTVYDFNKPAISCYKRSGFEEYRFKSKGRRFEDEYWDMIIMRLKRKTWLNKRSSCILHMAVWFYVAAVPGSC